MKTVKLFQIWERLLDQEVRGVIPAVSAAQARQFYQSFSGCSNAEVRDVIITVIGEAPQFMEEVKDDFYIRDMKLKDLKKLIDGMVLKHGPQSDFKVSHFTSRDGLYSDVEYHVVAKRPIPFERLKREAKTYFSKVPRPPQ